MYARVENKLDKQAESNMEQSSSQRRKQPYHSIYQLALDRIDTGVWVIDDSWHLVYMNSVMEQMTRRPRSKLLGKNTISEEHWFIRSSYDLVKKIQEAKETGDPKSYENIATWKGQESRTFQRGTIFPLMTTKGSCRGVLVTVEEVTKHVQSLEKISSLERTIRLIDALQASRSSDNPLDLVETFLDELASWREVDIASFIYVDSINSELAIKVNRGVLLSDLPPELHEQINAEAEQTVAAADMMTGEISVPGRSIEAVSIPIKADDSIVAVLIAGRRGYPYGQKETEAFITATNVLSTMLNEQRLKRENRNYEVKHHMIVKSAGEGLKMQHLTRRREQQLEALNEISRTSHNSFNLAEMLSRSLDTVAGVMGWETAGGIYLLDRARNMLVLVAHRSLKGKACCNRTEIPLDFGACGLSAKTGELIVLDGHTSSKMCRGDMKQEAALTIAVPLKVRTEALGVMFLYPEVVFHMSNVEREILKTLGEQLGLIVKNAEMQHKMTELSTIDEQTGAYNFRRFIEQVQSEFQRAKRYKEPFTIVNILYEIKGMSSTEEDDVLNAKLLKAIAEATKKSSRNTDTIYRYGKHEFAVLLTSTGKSGASPFMKRLNEALTKTASEMSGNAKVKIGVGSISCPEDTENEMELIDRASKLARTELSVDSGFWPQPASETNDDISTDINGRVD